MAKVKFLSILIYLFLGQDNRKINIFKRFGIAHKLRLHVRVHPFEVIGGIVRPNMETSVLQQCEARTSHHI